MTTSSTWTFEPGLRLLGCGVDAETIDRFDRLQRDDAAWPLVFSDRERRHLRALPQPAVGFCAAFCCKEALFKALRQPYDFAACELLYQPGVQAQQLVLAATLRDDFEIAAARAEVLRVSDAEVVAAVFLFGPS